MGLLLNAGAPAGAPGAPGASAASAAAAPPAAVAGTAAALCASRASKLARRVGGAPTGDGGGDDVGDDELRARFTRPTLGSRRRSS